MPTDTPRETPRSFADCPEFLMPAEWQALSDVIGVSSAGLLFLRDDTILFVNENLAGTLGNDAAELAGRPLESLHPIMDAAGTQVTLTGKDGQPIHFDRKVQTVGSPNGGNCTVWILQPPAMSKAGPQDMPWAALVDNLPEPVLACAQDGSFLYANPAFCKLLGCACDELERRCLNDLVHREDRAQLELAMRQANGKAMPTATVRLLDRDESWRHVFLQLRALAAPVRPWLLLSAHDVTGHIREQRAAAAVKKRQLHYMNRLFRLAHQPQGNFTSALKTILKASAKALGAHRCSYWEFDHQPAATRCVMAYDDLRQSLVEEAPGPLFATSFHPLLRKVILSEHAFVAANVDRDPLAALACEYFHAAGIKALIVMPVPWAERPTGLLIVSESRDGCAWGDDEAELVQHAGELIGRTFREAERAHGQAQRPASSETLDGAPCTAFFVGLEDVGHVRESLGADAGDALMTAAALRLKKIARKDDALLQPDSDSFMLLAHGMSDLCAADDVAQQIDETMRDVFILQGQELRISISVGVALYPADGTDLDTLMDTARQRGQLARRSAAFHA